MIRIGLSQKEKQKTISDYISTHMEIKKVYVLFYKKFKPSYKVDVDIEYIEYSNIIMYKFFYRLLEEIGNTSLIVVDGCVRTLKRNDLTYNCAHHYLNQTDHRIIFDLLPIVQDKNDMMILFDFNTPNKFKGRSFEYVMLQTEDIKIKPYHLKLSVIPVDTSENQLQNYEKKRDILFDNLGLGGKDPETIPRQLQLLAGDFKKPAVEPNKQYVARNKRFKLANVASYADDLKKQDYIVIDMYYSKLQMVDFIKQTGAKNIKYLATTLPIDTVVITEFSTIRGRLEAIYAKANIYK